MKELTISDIIEIGGVFNDGDWVESKDQNPNGLVRLIQLADIGDGYFINKSQRFLTKSTAQRLKCTFLRKGDILIARMPDPIGRACIFPGLEQEAVTVVDVCIIRPNNKGVFVPFLKFLINSPTFRQQIARHVTGTTRKRISRKNLNKVTFHLPSLTDQKRIAKVLSDCEQLIAWRKESIQLLDDYLESVFLEMFGDPVKNEKGWDVKKLSDLSQVKIGPFGSLLKKDEYITDGIPIVNPSHIENNKIVVDKKFTVSIEKSKALSAYKLMVHDIILGRRGEIGRCAIIDEKSEGFLCGTGSLFIRQSKKIIPSYLEFFIKSKRIRGVLESVAKGVTMKNINSKMIEQLNIPLPPISLQENFDEKIEKLELIKEKLNKSILELENLYSSLSQRAFKGELDLSKVVVDEEAEPTPSSSAPPTLKTDPQQQLNLKKAATQKQAKRDIRNLSLLDYYEVPAKLYQDKVADDYSPELDFVGDDLFYQFYLKDHFADQSFTFSDLQQKFNSYYIPKGQDFDPQKWKSILYKFMEGKQPLVEQIFEEKTGTIKLKLTDEAFKA
ncbi:MAG: restriction endonuclease subunit S [Bacteroidota bacterium]